MQEGKGDAALFSNTSKTSGLTEGNLRGQDSIALLSPDPLDLSQAEQGNPYSADEILEDMILSEDRRHLVRFSVQSKAKRWRRLDA